MPILLLMRHAKSDWDADYGPDHERPLNDRGVKSARVMGEVLAKYGLTPRLVISSTAVRARLTAELAIESGGWDAPLILEPELYGTGPEAAMTVATQAPNVDRMMLVGHQPTWSRLVDLLTGESPEMKTATVAVVEIPGDDWGEVAPDRGTLLRVIQPRDYL
jgi:phosphohistidine phosphatase